MKTKITLTKQELGRLIGKAKAEKVMGNGFHFRFKRKEIKRIEKSLSRDRLITLSLSASGNLMRISPRFVKILPRYTFQVNRKLAVQMGKDSRHMKVKP